MVPPFPLSCNTHTQTHTLSVGRCGDKQEADHSGPDCLIISATTRHPGLVTHPAVIHPLWGSHKSPRAPQHTPSTWLGLTLPAPPPPLSLWLPGSLLLSRRWREPLFFPLAHFQSLSFSSAEKQGLFFNPPPIRLLRLFICFSERRVLPACSGTESGPKFVPFPELDPNKARCLRFSRKLGDKLVIVLFFSDSGKILRRVMEKCQPALFVFWKARNS